MTLDVGFGLLVSGLLGYLLHSTLLIGATALAERLGWLRRLPRAAIETLWRWALFGGLLTAGVQAWQTLPSLAPPPALDTAVAAAPDATSRANPAIVAVPALTEPREPSGPQPTAPPHRVTLDLQPLLHQTAAVITVLWLLVAASLLALLPVRLAWLRSTVRRLPLSDDRHLHQFAAGLCQRAGLRTPRLRLSRRWTSPLLAPGGEVCLPLWFSQDLTPPQREAVLAHELAHLRRRDPSWRLAGQIIAALGWLQPLNTLARHRLDALAELACDDWAARMTGHRHALAESLYVCAQQLKKRRAPTLAVAMASPKSPLLQRMHSLLEEPDMNEIPGAAAAHPPTSPKSRRLAWLVGGAFAAAVLLLPAIVVRNADARDGGFFASLGHLTEVLDLGSRTRIESTWPGGKLRVTVRGPIEYNEAEDDVIALSGRLDGEETAAGTTRRLHIESQPDGAALKRSYAVDGVEQTTIDAAGRAWIAKVVAMAAEATISHELRVKKLYARGGADAVLASIEKSASDHARRARIEALLKLGALDATATARVLDISRRLDVDFERRAILQALIRSQPLNDAQQQALLESAAGLGSDFERRQVLVSLSPTLSANEAVLAAWLRVVQGTGSDFEIRTVLEALMQRASVTPAQVDAALQASLQLGSDFERRTVLQAVARRIDPSRPAQWQAYCQSANGIGSDFERRSALVALIDAQPLDKSASLSLLDAVSGIDSNFERVTLLQALARHMPADRELIDRYRQLARGLSDFERGQAEKALDRLAGA